MADIDIVKKGSRAWLWIVLLIVVALIVWFAMAGNNPQPSSHLNEGGQPPVAAARPLTSLRG